MYHSGMTRSNNCRSILLALLFPALLILPERSAGVLFVSTDDPAYNTNAPSGPLLDSGWQYQGKFGLFLGTAIAPHYFLTARHLLSLSPEKSVSTNTPFVFAGVSNHVTAFLTCTNTDESVSDLLLCRVFETLPRYAPAYTGTEEVGAPIVVFGRGTRRGSAVVTAGVTNGWTWGSFDQVQRWGSNRVEAIVGPEANPLLYATFDPDAGPDECSLSYDDSGGGVFLLADGVWQLAGINYAVDGPFSTNSAGANSFQASICNGQGLYEWNGSGWSAIEHQESRGFVATRVSSHIDWLTRLIPDFDSNANGIPDGWERHYSGSIHGLAATDDPDQDGMNNLAEWIARTDPTNALSFFKIDGITRDADAATLSFFAWTNRLYRVFARDALLPGTDWEPALPDPVPLTNGPYLWTDTRNTPPVTARFYRIEAHRPP